MLNTYDSNELQLLENNYFSSDKNFSNSIENELYLIHGDKIGSGLKPHKWNSFTGFFNLLFSSLSF